MVSLNFSLSQVPTIESCSWSKPFIKAEVHTCVFKQFFQNACLPRYSLLPNVSYIIIEGFEQVFVSLVLTIS